MYRFVTMHISGEGGKDDGENVHMVLKMAGKGRDKSGELWDKFETVGKFSTKDYGDEPWLAKSAAMKLLRELRGRRK